MSDATAGKGDVGQQLHFSISAAEVGVEVLQEAGVAEQWFELRNGDEPHDSRPFIGFADPIRDSE